MATWQYRDILFSLFLFHLTAIQLHSETNRREVLVVLLYPFTSCEQLITAYLPFASASLVAADTINNSSSLNFNLSVVFNDTRCSELVGISAMTYQRNRGVHAFIGPGSQSFCATSARVAAAWNLPMISYFCDEDVVTNKLLYPTFARTRPPNSQLSRSILAVLKKFSWKRVAIIYCHSDDCFSQQPWENTKEDMKRYFEDNGIEVTYEARMPLEHEQDKFDQVLEEIKTKARIVILATYPEFAPAFMVAAKRKSMTNGDYAYIISTVSDIHQYEGVDYWWRGISAKVDQAEVEKAWHSVLTLVPRPYNFTKYKTFEQQVIEKSKFNDIPWKRPNVTGKVLHYAVYLYDAVYLYALALNKTFLNGQDPKNGTAVFNHMKRTQFESVAGYEVRVDDNGDVEFNMTLLEFVKNDSGAEMKLVGEFKLNKTGTNQILDLLPGINITWSEDGQRTPPLDRPVCGFMGELCLTPSPSPTQPSNSIASITAAVVVSSLVVVCTVLALFYFRKHAFEKELASLIWKVNYGDIVIRSNMSLGMSRLSNMSEVSVANRPQAGITVGTYKGNPVVIKRVVKDQVDLTRTVLLELKQIREVHHPNLTRFFGACVEAPNICILTEYCSRGSLQEIILNEEIKLDNIFIHSFILEIATGMEYLHSVDIKFHGHLTSSNCVVDSRWILKITDHGLREFKSPSELSVRSRTYQADYSRLLWTAPEILRQKDKRYMGSPKGDVYSFGIIVHELETRNLPFSDCHLEAEEIVGRVLAGTSPPFRPPLPANVANEDLHLLMKMCWKEIPEDRPDFWEIRKLLKKLHGRKNNLVDRIIYMLEEHSLNLEKLVEKRTEQWIEEKKRTEELLHNMLPKSVADQLKSGRPVEAETFDEVTVFFSDIVGFTALSSESTPLQIVTLLNDLYTTFDAIINGYDVYKVETIGDAYMVVSGLPIRNGHQHAGEIACMALHLLQSVQKFKIQHRPDEKLKLRIGIHSGPVCAGVVGLKMPRYCLFGDTVNTASRMESNGEALKIHISAATKHYLERIGGYVMQERGSIDIKGKGTLVTYWLHGRVSDDHSSKAIIKTTSEYSSSGIECAVFIFFTPATGSTKYSSNATYKICVTEIYLTLKNCNG